MHRETRDQVQPFLHSGERLIAVCPVEPAPGVPTPPAHLVTLAEPPALVRRVEEMLPGRLRRLARSRVLDPQRSRPAAAADAVDRAPDMLDEAAARLVHGPGMEGGWQSTAGDYVIRRAGTRGWSGDVLVVTDRRWFAVRDASPLWQSAKEFRLYWEAPRTAVTALRAQPKGVLQKGRMDLWFADGSWVALCAELPAHAQPFAEAAARYA
ncbi:hypothetical protein [Streptomyces bambusae]|uniref:Uncharacterized protein n=1 Tax=Streptomyces bambusae TaxID=1550616 RepID=A0ABS6Z4Q8_9ACTN|nr:hypothetical protein [Streptomyces bambusae]MBW5482758.1 hypothetical protein [Streptomyces bambusae]